MNSNPFFSLSIVLPLQQGPQDGPDTAQLDRGGRVRTDQDAQLPALGIEPSACQFFQIQHLNVCVRDSGAPKYIPHKHTHPYPHQPV